MIQGDNYIFVENPRTGSTALSEVLLYDYRGSLVTPRHGALTQKADRYTFTVVRNPYERMSSLYYYDTENGKTMTFEEWFERDNFFQHTPQLFWCQNCDAVLRYESLNEDLKELGEYLGKDLTLPSHSVTEYPKLIKSQKDMIYKRFKEDFKELGYKKS